MSQLKKYAIKKFQEWAEGYIQTIFAQYIGYSILEFFNHYTTIISQQWVILSYIFDAIWWLDTLYTVTSLYFKIFRHKSDNNINY
jgi:hypothetical protein